MSTQRMQHVIVAMVGIYMVIAAPATAITMFWNNGAGGSASTISNWSPAQMPTSADALLYGVNDTFTVTFNSSVPQSLTQNVGSGLVTLNFTSPHTTQSLLVADATTQTSSAIVTGDLVASLVRLGNTSSNNGTLTLDGFLSSIDTNSTIVGDDGIGTLNVIFGSDFDAGALTVGRFSTASGTVNVNDAPTFPPNSPHLQATTGIIGESGDGVLHVFDDGVAHFTADLTLGANSTSTGLVDIDDGSLTVDQDIHINGTGTFSVGNGASIVVNGTTFVGGATGNGTLVMNGTGQFRTNSLSCTNLGVLNLSKGTLIVDGGTLTPPGGQLVLDPAAGVGVLLEMRNKATMTLSSFGGIQVDQGELRLNSGSTVNAGPGSVIIGGDAGQAGVLTINDGATLNASQPIAGTSGDGAIFVNANGTLNASTALALGVGSTGFGTLDVQGSNAHVNTPILQVGGSAGGVGNIGIVTIHDAGRIDVTQTGFVVSTTIFPEGAIHVLDGGTLDVNASIDVQGVLSMLGGVVNADSINIKGEVSGHGAINSVVGFSNNTADVINASGGTLTLGDSNDVNGYNGSLGTLNIGTAAVTIHDANGARLGITTLNGGTLNLADDSELLQNIGNTIVLSGKGTITGDWSNQAIVSSTSTGLIIQNGELTSNNFPINGEVITFGNEGDFIGFGTIDCRVITQTGSSIKATGNLTMGDSANTVGVTLGGTLDVGSHTVTMLDSNFVPLGTLTKLNGGTLITPVQAINGLNDVLSGVGTIQSSLANNGGIIRPGGTGIIGTLTVTGAYTSGVAPTLLGDLEVEIASLASVDRLACSSTAALDGDLIVKPINGFVPVIGQEFVVLTASSISGSYDNVSLLNVPSTLAADVIISATQVRVKIIANPCPADVTPPGGNGAVNVDDLLTVINNWGNCPPPPTTCLGDIAPGGGNGVINVDDLLAVINGWGGCP
jgi:hypothetical protein